MNTIYYTHKGEQIRLNEEIGRGGEGPVYSIEGRPSECAKIYSKKLTTEDHNKLLSMVNNPPTDQAYISRKHTSIAWPQSILYTDSSKTQLAGFVMPKIDGKIFRKAINYLDPSDRLKFCGGGFTWQHLFTTAFNITSAAAAVHERGYYIGDINESNILIAPDALITLIDCDSFQVKDNTSGKTYRCLVGKPEYTAPELQGKSYKDVDRTVETDSFALAVLIFQLLMEGTHPYQAKGKLVDDAAGTHEKIIKGYFPYTCKLSGISPPDYAPSFNILHPDMQRLFHRCFVDGHKNPGTRPTAKEWFDVFKSCGSKFKRCSTNENHYYIEHLNNCPWCEIRNKTGNDPFPSPIGQQIALEDPTKSLDSLEKRIDYLRTYIDMALSDGVLTADERDYIIDIGAKLQISQKEVDKVLNAEIKKSDAKTSAVSIAGTPIIEINKTSFDFSNLKLGASASDAFAINNSGGGSLSGPIKSNKKWLKVSQGNIDISRHRQEISFQVDTTGLDYGTKDTGIIEIQSNGGTGRIPVIISIEEDEEAIKRFRYKLNASAVLFGFFFGIFIYSLNFVSGMNANVEGVASFFALIGAVYVAAKWDVGLGLGTFLSGLIILAILRYFPLPQILSIMSWAIICYALADISAKTIWRSRQMGKQIAIGAGVFIPLAVGIIIYGWLMTVYQINANAARVEAEKRANEARVAVEKKANKTRVKVRKPAVQGTSQPPTQGVETIVASSDHFTYKRIPDGREFKFFCPDGTLMDFTYNGMTEEEKGFIDCDIERRNVRLGDYKTGRRIGFMSKDGAPKYATVKILTVETAAQLVPPSSSEADRRAAKETADHERRVAAEKAAVAKEEEMKAACPARYDSMGLYWEAGYRENRGSGGRMRCDDIAAAKAALAKEKEMQAACPAHYDGGMFLPAGYTRDKRSGGRISCQFLSENPRYECCGEYGAGSR